MLGVWRGTRKTNTRNFKTNTGVYNVVVSTLRVGDHRFTRIKAHGIITELINVGFSETIVSSLKSITNCLTFGLNSMVSCAAVKRLRTNLVIYSSTFW